MNTLLDMLNACECREDDENFKSAVDLLFEQLEQRNPDHFAARQYKKFKMAAGKTLKSILISCGARLAPFDSAATRCRIQTLRGIFLQRGKSDGKAIAFLTDIPRSGMTG
jgi:hypothetical protein